MLFPRYFAFLLMGLFATNINANDNSCVVLMYHHFSETTPKITSISPQLFEQHLRYLKDNKFNVLPLKTMLRRLKEKNLPEKCVSLSADDAYLSIFSAAYPLLKKYAMSLAVFVATEAADKKYKGILSWQQMRDMQGEHIAFYNHSITHAHLLDLSVRERENEINKAQQRLHSELGVSDKIFAYPYGEADLALYQQVQNLGWTAFGQQSGALSYDSDLQNLPRFPMSADFAQMKSFKLKINTLTMPIKTKRINPVLGDDLMPLLTLEFKQSLSKSAQKQFNCFAHGGTKIVWLNDKIVNIRSKKPISDRRSRYNCTLPSKQKYQYHWFSTQWIKPKN